MSPGSRSNRGQIGSCIKKMQVTPKILKILVYRKVVLTTDRNLGATDKNSVSDFTFTPKIRIDYIGTSVR